MTIEEWANKIQSHDIPQAVHDGFIVSERMDCYVISCKRCNKKWSHPLRAMDVRSMRKVLDHNRAHDHKGEK